MAAFLEVEDSERPDFILHTSPNSCFGVEVTEFYLSEPDARLVNIPGYVLKLLDGGPHLHKDDVEALKVDEITITAPDGTVRAVTKGVMQMLPGATEYVEMAAAAIADKNAAFAKYRTDVSHINLIVLDRSDRFRTLPPDQLTPSLLAPTMRSVLAQTGFREVFFVTRLDKSHRVFIPLRMLLLLSDLYMFNAALIAFSEQESPSVDAGDQLEVFATFSRLNGVPVVMVEDSRGGPKALLGASCVSIEDNGVIVTDYADFPLPPTRPPRALAVSLPPEFHAFYERFVTGRAFSSGLALDVRTDTSG